MHRLATILSVHYIHTRDRRQTQVRSAENRQERGKRINGIYLDLFSNCR